MKALTYIKQADKQANLQHKQVPWLGLPNNKFPTPSWETIQSMYDY